MRWFGDTRAAARKSWRSLRLAHEGRATVARGHRRAPAGSHASSAFRPGAQSGMWAGERCLRWPGPLELAAGDPKPSLEDGPQRFGSASVCRSGLATPGGMGAVLEALADVAWCVGPAEAGWLSII